MPGQNMTGFKKKREQKENPGLTASKNGFEKEKAVSRKKKRLEEERRRQILKEVENEIASEEARASDETLEKWNSFKKKLEEEKKDRKKMSLWKRIKKWFKK